MEAGAAGEREPAKEKDDCDMANTLLRPSYEEIPRNPLGTAEWVTADNLRFAGPVAIV